MSMPSIDVPRLAVVQCPHWPVVALGAQAAEPVAVLHANRVVAHSVAAAAAGVRLGQRRREAQARCALLRLEPADPARDSRCFEPVVEAVIASVPRLEVGDPGTITFRSIGPARYFGGEQAMVEHVRLLVEHAVALDAVGGVRVGVADGRFAAVLAAQQQVLVPPGESAAFLSPQPVRVLARWAEVPAELVHLLERLGLHRLGQVAGLPVADLVARFGPLGAFVHRLAAGGDDRVPGAHEPPLGVGVQRVFEPALHHSDAVVFAARQAAEELVAGLASAGRVCTQVLVVVETEHGERSERVWQRSTGLSAAAVLERVRWQLEGWAHEQHLTAGVALLRLDPVEVRTDDGVQLGMWGGRSQADEWAARAVARLVALAGEEHVLVPAAGGGRHAADAYRWVPAVGAELDQPALRFRSAQGPWPGSLPSPSPAIVHEPMVPLEVLDSEGRTVQVSGRGFVSAPPSRLRSAPTGVARVKAWAGPWPIDERWWDTAKARRLARFQLLTTEGRLWLAVVEGGAWWLSAEYR